MDANFADQRPNVENFENQVDYYQALIDFYRQGFIRAGVVDQNGVPINRIQNRVQANDNDFEINDIDY